STSIILGQMANLFAVIAPRPGLCSASYSAVSLRPSQGLTGLHTLLLVSKSLSPQYLSVYRTAIDPTGHSGSWLSRSSSSKTLPNLTPRSRSSK
ncbi:hypothetical protein Tco_0402988, partial [Tanacetum coccineum]